MDISKQRYLKNSEENNIMNNNNMDGRSNILREREREFLRLVREQENQYLRNLGVLMTPSGRISFSGGIPLPTGQVEGVEER